MSAPDRARLITEVDFSARPFRCRRRLGRHLPRRRRHHRHRRPGPLARPRVGAAAAGPRRLRLRHLRRVLLPRQARRGDRRRQHRGRGGAVPDPPRRQRDPGPPPRLAARREDPAAAAVRQPEDQRGLGQRGGGDPGRRHARGGHRRAAAQHEDRRRQRRWRVDGVFIAIGHTPNTAIFRGQVDDGRARATSRPRRARTRTSVAGRVRRGRRAGQDLPPGGHRRRHRLHGGAGGGEVPRRKREHRLSRRTSRIRERSNGLRRAGDCRQVSAETAAATRRGQVRTSDR